MNDGGLELLCSLTQSPYEPLALNALWAIKNLVFHSSDGLKTEIMMVFGWTSLRQFLGEPTLIPLRKQALEILQNLLAEATSADITKTLERLGEGQVLDILQELARDRESPLCAPVSDLQRHDSRAECRQSLYVISNLALGSEKTRNLLVGRVDMIEALSEAVNEPMSLRTSEAVSCRIPFSGSVLIFPASAGLDPGPGAPGYTTSGREHHSKSKAAPDGDRRIPALPASDAAARLDRQ